MESQSSNTTSSVPLTDEVAGQDTSTVIYRDFFIVIFIIVFSLIALAIGIKLCEDLGKRLQRLLPTRHDQSTSSFELRMSVPVPHSVKIADG